MFTPEGQFDPCDMAWWSLTCNIACEWRLVMAEAAPSASIARRASTAAQSDASSKQVTQSRISIPLQTRWLY